MQCKLDLLLAIATLFVGFGEISTIDDVGNSQETEQDLRSATNRRYEGLIIDELESLRTNAAIYPSLDMAQYHSVIDNGGTSLDISISNAELIGLPNFLTPIVNFDIGLGAVSGKLEVTLLFPEIVISAMHYGIEGIIGGILPMHSDGPFEIKISNWNMTAWGLAYIGVPPPTARLPVAVWIREVESDNHIEQLNVNMVNILGQLSDEFNLMLSEIGIDLLSEFKTPIDKALAKYLENLLNRLLNKDRLDNQEDADFEQDIKQIITEMITVTIQRAVEIASNPGSKFHQCGVDHLSDLA